MAAEAIQNGKNAADNLILRELHRRTDWVSVPEILIRIVQKAKAEGLIADWRCTRPEVKIGEQWYKLP